MPARGLPRFGFCLNGEFAFRLVNSSVRLINASRSACVIMLCARRSTLELLQSPRADARLQDAHSGWLPQVSSAPTFYPQWVGKFLPAGPSLPPCGGGHG